MSAICGFAGLRPGEVVALEVEDLYLPRSGRGTIRITKACPGVDGGKWNSVNRARYLALKSNGTEDAEATAREAHNNPPNATPWMRLAERRSDSLRASVVKSASIVHSPRLVTQALKPNRLGPPAGSGLTRGYRRESNP